MEMLMLKPAINTALWGGRKLIDEFGFETEHEKASEAWLLSCHEKGLSIVTNGKYAGKTFNEVFETEGKAILGKNNADKPGFPVLIKIIDACDKLSIQVHPDDDYAWKYENENGKTEAWYVVAAEPDAELIYGVDGEITKEEFEASINNNTLAEKLKHVPVKAGDVVFIPSGMIHAIGKGILIAEVQQSSNTTYRIYDYGRLDDKGKPRELHIKQACDVSVLKGEDVDFTPEGKTEKKEDAEVTYLTGCDYFRMTDIRLTGTCTFTAGDDSFVALTVLSGSGTITGADKTYELKKGSSVFIPASFGEYKIEGTGLDILETRT